MDDDDLWLPLPEAASDECEGGAEEWLATVASHTSEPPCDDAPLPMRRLWGSVREVPDFSQIPEERWEEVMRTIPERLRGPAAMGMGSGRLVELAMSDLPPTPSDRAREIVLGSPRLAPTPPRERGRRADRQVSFRLTHDEYVDLAAVAELLELTPAGLATALVRNGVRRILQEIDSGGSRSGS